MRNILHPGPVAAQRVTSAPTALRQHAVTLAPGQTLLAALRQALASLATLAAPALIGRPASAVLTLAGGTLWPFAFVLPALSKTASHAVYFSDRHDATSPIRLDFATVTFGERDGHPALHCHAQWREADGTVGLGHVLADDAWLTAPIQAQAWCLDGAAFVAQADAETGFSLLEPEPEAATQSDPQALPLGAALVLPNCLALRLRPNQDLCNALEALCRQHGISRATLRGGVGSTVGAVFDDGRIVQPFVTELVVRQGRIRPDARGAPMAEIDISLVDHLGGQASGRLQRGANPVLVTFEAVLQPD